MSRDQWYYAQNGERLGPVPLETLRAMVANNSVQPADYVWCEGMTNWEPAGTIAELARPAVAAPAVGYSQPAGYGQAGPGMMGYYTPNAYTGAFPGYAGFWMRFAAAFIDGLILWVFGVVILMIVGLFIGVITPSSGRRGQTPVAAMLPLMGNCFTIVVQFLYYTLQESSRAQATWGKRAVGILVTNEIGGPITYGQAVGRFFGKWVSWIILGFGFFMAGWTQRKQGLHDMMAGTLVVRRS